MRTLFDISALPLTLPDGVIDVTASVDPELPAGGLVEGMKFSITWPATNTGPMTLALNGGAAAAIVTAGGEAMTPGMAQSGARALLEFVGTDYRVLITGDAGDGGAVSSREIIIASQTWLKPAGVSDDAVVLIEMWGGGGGGDNSDDDGSGAGGEFARGFFTMADIPSSVSAVVGAGGSAEVSGGASSFGTLLSAQGGGRGTSSAGGRGGGKLAFNGTYQATDFSGGDGCGTGTEGTRPGQPSLWGGGGGGGFQSARNNQDPHPGGQSKYGGAGGAGGQNGQIPGGGGGVNGGVGARGEIRIYIFG
ncbi:MAG: hypothetical protein GYB53_23245 [Rhodobacteraceae bacterium]|nr:hypothetical protein [Paracoccaceae bacterium]